MKFKKFLAVMLSAAMMVTSVNVTGLADLTAVMAAGETDNYETKVSVTSGGAATQTANCFTVERGDTITLSAEVLRREGKTTVDGTATYAWSVKNGVKRDAETNPDGIVTSDKNTISFKADQLEVGQTYDVVLTTTEIYTTLEDKENPIAEQDVTNIRVEVKQKTLSSDENTIKNPSFNNIYMHFDSDGKAKTELTLDELKAYENSGFKGTTNKDTYGEWEIDRTVDGKNLKVGENTVVLKYKIINDQFKSNYVNDKNTNGWKTANILERNATITVQAAEDRVTKINTPEFAHPTDNDSDSSSNGLTGNQLVYRDGMVAKDTMNTVEARLDFGVEYDAAKTTAEASKQEDYFDITTKGNIECKYVKETQKMTVTATAATTGTASLTITDKKGTGLSKTVNFTIFDGIVKEDTKCQFGTELSGAVKDAKGTMGTWYSYTMDPVSKNNTIETIFPGFAKSNKTAEPGKVSYSATVDGSNETAGTTEFTSTKVPVITRTYTLKGTEKLIKKNENGVYVLANENAAVDAEKIRINPYTVTEDYIKTQLRTIKVKDQQLFEGSELPYGEGLNASYSITNRPWLKVDLYYNESNNGKPNYVPVKTDQHDKPDVGKNSKYAMGVSLETPYDAGDYKLPDTTFYPFDLTVVAKELKSKISVSGAVTRASSDADIPIQGDFSEDVILQADLDTYDLVDTVNGTDYKYTYQWYDKNGKIEKEATSYQYKIKTSNATVNASGEYYCVVTATAITKGKGNLKGGDTATATTPKVTIVDSSIKVYAYEDSTGITKAVDSDADLGNADDSQKFETTVSAIKGIKLDATSATEPGFIISTTDNGYHFSNITLTLKAKDDKNSPDPVTFTDIDATKQYYYIKYTNAELNPDTYTMYVKATAEKAGTENKLQYDSKIGIFTLTAFDADTYIKKAANYVKDQADSMVYGTKLEDADCKVSYKFEISAADKTTLTSDGFGNEIAKIQELVNKNYDFTLSIPKDAQGKDAENQPLEVGKHTLWIIPTLKTTGTDRRVKNTSTKDLGNQIVKADAVNVTKQPVQLKFDSDKITWVVGSGAKATAHYDKKIDGFGDNIKYTYYTNYDKDTKKVSGVISEDELKVGTTYWVVASEDVTVKNYESQASEPAEFKMIVERTGISATPTAITLKAGEKSEAIKVNPVPVNADIAKDETPSFSSSDEKIATVDSKTGEVTAVSDGTAVITVKLLDKDGNPAKDKDEKELTSTVNVVVTKADTNLPKTQEEYDKAIEAAKKEATTAAEKAAQEKIDEANTAKAVAEKAQKDAEDAKAKAEADKAAAETAKTAAEEAKTKAEEAQKAAETAKTKAEEEKDAAVTDKLAAEAAQKTAEAEKATAEAAQKAAEADKAVAEAAKTAAEKAQADAEAAQKAAETKAAEAETAKAVAETKLADAEAAKAAAEADKAAAEAAKTAAEADKAAAEAAKTAAEADKAAAEAAKTKAEADKADAEAAKAAAETAKAEAETKAVEAKEAQEKAEAAQKEAEIKASESSKKVAVKKGQLVVYKNNIYKVTNVSKKTLTFVGTMSTAKTITIAKSVKIDGTSYKVTAIAKNALKGNKTAKKVVIPNTVKSIGKKAFANMNKNLKFKASAKVKKLANKAK